MMNIRLSRVRRGISKVALLVPVVLTACRMGVLDAQGPVASAERTILFDSLIIMLAVVVPTIVATLAFAWWFRASNIKARYLPTWAFSGQIEIIVWSIPLLVITLLGGVTWIGSHMLDPAQPLASKETPLEIQGVSLDWKWLFIYPDQRVATVNQLVVPAGVPIHFALTSASVLNTFFVPQLGSMIYTMNGMSTQLNLMADHPGVYAGLSGHFSGDGFPGMHFEVQAVAPDQFMAWVANTRRGGDILDSANYIQLAKQSMNMQPISYRNIDPQIFQNIVSQRLPPGPGPDPSEVSPGISSKREH